MYSTHNERKSVAAERFIRNLINKINKYITAISKNIYIDKLYGAVNKYNTTYHRTIKIKPIDVKKKYISGLAENNTDLRFKVGDHVATLKHTYIC